MSLFSEFDLFRRSVQHLFSEFERDYLNDRYLLDTHFADYPLMEQDDTTNDNDANMEVEKQNGQQQAGEKTNKKNKKMRKNNNPNNNANGTSNTNQLQPGGGGGLMTVRPSESSALLFSSPWSSSPLSLRSLAAPSPCRLDVIEKGDHWEVHAEVPGIPKENIKIEVVDGVLTLSGEQRSLVEKKEPTTLNANNNENKQNEMKDNNNANNNLNTTTTNTNNNNDANNQPQYHYRERSYSSFKRSLRLPENIESDKITAKYDNGLLELSLPKKEKIVPKAMNIQIA